MGAILHPLLNEETQHKCHCDKIQELGLIEMAYEWRQDITYACTKIQVSLP